MRYLRLIAHFLQVSFQEEAAYSANFAISLLHSLLNLATGVLAILVLFGQVQDVHGWDFNATLALLGIYLTVSALRGLFIGPGLEALAGIDGEIWKGTFDYTIIRPLNTQFLVSVRKWRPFALLDLLFGLGLTGVAAVQLRLALGLGQALVFFLALAAGILTLYAFLLAFTALVFWNPGVLFTWIFDGFFQLARYPIGMYPGWLRLVLTWVIPVGIITTIPAQALTGSISLQSLGAALGFSLLLAAGASLLFRAGLKRYSSASS